MDGDKRLQYLNYCMHRINLLRHHKITPVLVFDGGNLPSKAQTENDRHRQVTFGFILYHIVVFFIIKLCLCILLKNGIEYVQEEKG